MGEALPLPQRLEQRLKALREELETGRKMLAELEAQRLGVEQTTLRISGAIQVLEELLAGESPAANGTRAQATAAAGAPAAAHN
jgi:hypothetical protein